MSDGLIEAINRIAAEAIGAGTLPVEEPIRGVHALDLWRDGSNGAMLFWVDATADAYGRGESLLFEVIAKSTGGRWRAVACSAATSAALREVSADLPAGLHRVGRSSSSGVFLTSAFVTPDVVTIRLQDDSGRIRDRPPGRHGRVLLGVTSEDPLTHAYALDREGKQCATEPLTLWAPPRG